MVTKIGTPGNDILKGTAGADIIGGRGGRDSIQGLAGADKLYGDSGHDRVFGEDGTDLVVGGSGNDQLDGGNGDDQLAGQEGNDVLRGGNGDDRLTGDDDFYEADLLYAGPGNDQLSLGSGDTAYGGDGADRFLVCDGSAYGEEGNDAFFPDIGCDTVDAPDGYGTSDATVRGGPSADRLDFTTPGQTSGLCGTIHVTFVGWQPGIDRVTGAIWTWTFPEDGGDGHTCYDSVPVYLGSTRDYLLQRFDTNRDKRISKADGQVFLADGSSLTFPINPLTGKQSLLLKVLGNELHLPDVTTLF